MMKRPRTRVAEAIAIKAYHAQMGWLHALASNKYEPNGRTRVRWMIGKAIDKPELAYIR